jgi:hypothetical protein
VTPRSLGGTDDERNLLTVCADCHGMVNGMHASRTLAT